MKENHFFEFASFKPRVAIYIICVNRRSFILALAFTACSKENLNTPGGDLGSESDSSSKPNNSNTIYT